MTTVTDKPAEQSIKLAEYVKFAEQYGLLPPPEPKPARKLKPKVTQGFVQIGPLSWEVSFTIEPSKNGMDVFTAFAPDRPALTPGQLDTYPAELDLDVSYADIVNGTPGSPKRCAVALAVSRRFDGAQVHVGGQGIHIHHDHSGPLGIFYYDPTGQLSSFISKFDQPFQKATFGDYTEQNALRFQPAGRRVQPTTIHLVRSN